MAWPTSSRQSRGYGAEWDRTRKRILKRDGYQCQPCLRKDIITPAAAVDHIKRKADGGTDADENLESTCDPCHTEKTAHENGQRLKSEIGADGWPVS